MRPLPETLADWMTFLDAEIAAVCEPQGWGRQVRRKWSVREKPVADSPIADYEWKLIPNSPGLQPPIHGRDSDEGCFYVFGIDTARRMFSVLHDTFHVGDISISRCLTTSTEFSFDAVQHSPERKPGPWQLRDFVLAIVGRSHPNSFSLT